MLVWQAPAYFAQRPRRREDVAAWACTRRDRVVVLWPEKRENGACLVLCLFRPQVERAPRPDQIRK